MKHAVYQKIEPLKNILLLRSGDSNLICHSVISNQNNAMMLAKIEKEERTKTPKVSFQNQITLSLALLGVSAQVSFINFVGTDFKASARYKTIKNNYNSLGL